MLRSAVWISLIILTQWTTMSIEAQGAEDDDEYRKPSTVAKYIDSDPATGRSAAVIIDDVPLIYTGLHLPYILMPDDKVRVPEGVHEQFDLLQWTTQGMLGSLLRSGLHRLVKVNYYAATNEAAEQLRQELKRSECGPVPCPAISIVVTKFEHPDVLVAMDCVAQCHHDPKMMVLREGRHAIPGRPVRASTAIAPAGRRIYISGQAEPSKEVAEATRLTMQSLVRTLKHLGRDVQDVIQIKSFLGPISETAVAERELGAFFPNSLTPPLVFVEWSSSLPIEIEMVVWGGPRPADEVVADPIEFITPPGMAASPVFCRVTRVSAPETIFISGLWGSNAAGAPAETQEIFESLGKILNKTGSDFRHLAKATYYVSTDDASTRLNEIRPKFYDPQRPPAASKAVVASPGKPGKTITLDMIAVRKK